MTVLSKAFDLGPNHPIRTAFYRHGIYCATHQIRVIIISCVLICVLLYPALATHYSSQPLSHFSTKMLDSFMPPNTPATAFRTDVRHVWEGHEIFHIREDPAALARCGTERTIRIERVIVPSNTRHARGALNRDTLRSALELQRNISSVLAENDFTDVASCVRDGRGTCLFLSPLSFWGDDEEILNTDSQIVKTVNFGRNSTLSGIPLHASTTLAGRASDPHSGKTTYAADFLVLTFFFPEVMCHDSFGHNLWIRGLEHAVSGSASISHTAYRPQLIALEYSEPSNNMASVSLAIYIVYVVACAYLAAPLWRMRSVHSRIGLAFTAFTELVASTVMSISVCVMWGWRVTMVPWVVLPAVIVIVGTENMWHLLSAVASTQITLPVKERVGIAMSQAGTSNTMELVAYNALLGTIASFTIGAVRQFCVFGMVVLVIHWFMIHTFWITILSIDAQRLELDELLRQIPESDFSSLTNGHGPQTQFGLSGKDFARPTTRFKALAPLRNFLRRHYAINTTLLMFLVLMAGLYWKYPFPSKQSQVRSAITHGILSPSPEQSPSPMSSQTSEASHTPFFDPAQRFWDMINPTNQSMVHVRIETPTIVQLRPVAEGGAYQDPGWLWNFFYNTLRPGLWMIKIMVLPIGATMGLLWGFLMYLLKDTDVLEAQRHRPPAEVKRASNQLEKALGDSVSFSVLPRALAADVDLISSSRDGRVVVSVSIDNEVVCWKLDDQGKCRSHIALHASLPEGILRLPVITSLSVNDRGDCCAVGSESGNVFVWLLHQGRAEPLPPLVNASAVSSLFFLESGGTSEARLSEASPASMSNGGGPPRQGLIVAHTDGTTVEWHIAEKAERKEIVTPAKGSSVTSARIISEGHASSLFHIAVFNGDSTIEILRRDEGTQSWQPLSTLTPQTPGEALLDIAFLTTPIGDSMRTVAVTASSTGKICVWDAADGSVIHANHVNGKVNRLCIAPMPNERCQNCGEVTMDGFIIVAGMDDSLQVLRATVPLGGRRCTCLHDQLFTAPSLTASEGSQSDSPRGSLSTSVPSSPMRKKVSGLNLPVPETLSQAMPPPAVRPPRIEVPDRPPPPAERRASAEDSSSSSVPPSPLALSVDFQSTRSSADIPRRNGWQGYRSHGALEIQCERGAWDLVGHVIVGVRRRSASDNGVVTNGRSPSIGKLPAGREADDEGLREQDLRRWEVWTVDPSEVRPNIQASELSQLVEKEASAASNQLSTSPRPKAKFRAFPRLPFTRVPTVSFVGRASCAAGFGNTIGIVDFSRSTTSIVPRSAAARDSEPSGRRGGQQTFISPRVSTEERQL